MSVQPILRSKARIAGKGSSESGVITMTEGKESIIVVSERR
jgi:hypothetical protein